MRKLLLVGLFFLSSLFLTKQACADNNFATSFTGTYYVKDTGVTHAVFTVSLKNLTDRFYPTSYSLQLGFKDIEHVYASDPDGVMTPTLVRSSDGQSLTFTFNHRSIGLGSSLPFTFSFDTTDVATKNGSIWEVNIPGLRNQNDFSNFAVSVIVPPYFGKPVYMKPDVGDTLTFSKTQLGTSGISIAFGSTQAFHFSLAYHLKNNQLFPVHTEIALPSNTSYQDVSIDNLSPKPSNVFEDSDGNWLAQYSLLPSQVVTVHADGRAFLSLEPTKQAVSSQKMQEYLKPTTYWQATNPKIVTLGKDLHTPYAIYEYVVKTLHYDFSRVSNNQDRLGALGVLQTPSSAVCLEFTDLFIALSRAAGIPAREIDGYAYTQNSRERPLSLQKDILHAWPEYYDTNQQTWIMVDPTWENTTGGVDYFHTFDFDHIAFVIKGENTDYPIPAGGYKLPGQEKSQDVDVTFAQDLQEPMPSGDFAVSLPTSAIGGFPMSGHIILKNTSSVLFPSQPVLISFSPLLMGLTGSSIDSPEIPPFGFADLSVSLGKVSFLTNVRSVATIQFAGKKSTSILIITPFSLQVFLIGGGILLVILSIIIRIITKRAGRVSIPG